MKMPQIYKEKNQMVKFLPQYDQTEEDKTLNYMYMYVFPWIVQKWI